MYPVSDAFLRAVQENTRNYCWTGQITTKGGAVYPFVYEDIVKGSGYLTAQCCGSAEIELGTVYAAEMGITLFSQIDRYTLEGAEVRLSYHLRLADGSFEEVPMGIFEVSEANRTAHCLELKAYDYMLRFEKSFNGFETVGNAWAFLDLCCKACNVVLAHTQAEIEAMPNGTELLSIYPENDIETYRDVLYFVGQVLGGFFCINREGKLELRKYGTQPVMEVKSRHRFTSSFSDFITRYTAVSSTNLRTQTAEYYALEPDDGLTMNLAVNPLLQFGLEETRETLCRNILNDLAVVSYVPFDSSTIGNPALDLGDVLTFTGGQADGSQTACITSSNCRIGGKHTLKCVGKNPRLAQAKSKNDKNISGLLNQIEAGKIGIHTFTNASAYTVAETSVRIISIEFAAKEETHVQFFGQVLVDVSAGQVSRSASAKGSIVVPFPAGGGGLIHYPVETWGSGKHILSLYYPIDGLVPNITNTFNVHLRMEGGTAAIDTGGCIASISGQGMAAGAAWDGTITVEEYVQPFTLKGGLQAKAFSGEMGFETMELVKKYYSDSIRKAGIGAFGKPVELPQEPHGRVLLRREPGGCLKLEWDAAPHLPEHGRRHPALPQDAGRGCRPYLRDVG